MTDARTLTLTDFLLACIAEDEAVAQAAGPGRWKHDGSWWLEGVEHEVVGPDEVAFTHPAYVTHIARHDPAHVLAVCAAHRRIVGLHDVVDSSGGCAFCGEPAPCDHLRALGSVYADRPGFQEAWR
jgi:hypothetical protein